MQMIWQYDPTVNFEGMGSAHPLNRIAQAINTAHQQIVAVSLQQIHRKEVGAAWMPCTPIVGYINGSDLSCGAIRCAIAPYGATVSIICVGITGNATNHRGDQEWKPKNAFFHVLLLFHRQWDHFYSVS